MEREYFCAGCGLFHWVNLYKRDLKTGIESYKQSEGCPNPTCVSHEKDDVPRFAVDSFTWAYFSESHGEFIEKMGWSSPKYAPKEVIEIYKKQGIRIEES